MRHANPWPRLCRFLMCAGLGNISWAGQLESLGPPVPLHGVPSTNMWAGGNLLFCESFSPNNSGGPFVVYDLTARKAVYSGEADIHDNARNVMVDRGGNAYFSVNGNGLAKYSPATNKVAVLPLALPNFLRASTRESSQGWIYGATGQDSPLDLFRLHPAQARFEKLGSSWGYTAHMILDPTEQYVYYVPRAHGSAWEIGTPLLQYEIKSGAHKVIAFLNAVYEKKYGYRLGGTYALDIDQEGKRVFINMNAEKVGVDRSGFGSPVLVVVHIPPGEAAQLARPWDAVTTPTVPHLGLSATVITDQDPAFLTRPPGASLPPHTVAQTEPSVDFTVIPHPAHAGNPWSSWGGGLYASNGRFYLAIGDHQAVDGNSYLYEYDPVQRKIACIGDAQTATGHIQGSTGHGKIHSQINEGKDGYIHMTTYWGSMGKVVFDAHYRGSVLLRYQIPGARVSTSIRRKPYLPRFAFANAAGPAHVEALLKNTYIHSASWGDVNGDGFPDLFVGTFSETAPTLTPNKLLINREGSFVDAGQQAIGTQGRCSGSVFADLDNDGDLDLVVVNNTRPGLAAPRNEPNRVFRNDRGTFIDVSPNSGIALQRETGRQAIVLDYNHDGKQDLFITADALTGSGNTALLRNNGGFKFEDVTAQAKIPAALHALGSAVADVTGDGFPDLFVAGGGAHDQNRLLIANGDGSYRPSQGGVFDWSSFECGAEDWVSSAAFGDLNRDGLPDLVVGHHFGTCAEKGLGAAVRVYLHQGMKDGEPRFQDVTDRAGLPKIISKAPHAEIQDFDNDGWPDIYVSIGIDTDQGRMPLIFGHKGLVDGIPVFDTPPIKNPHYYPGGPSGDFNRDGKLDVFFEEWRSSLGAGEVPPMLMENRGATGNWLQVRVGMPDNTMGIGAKVEIFRKGMRGQAGGRLGAREISPSFGYSSSQEAVAHFGLGAEQAVDVEVTLPFGGRKHFADNVQANQRIAIPYSGNTDMLRKPSRRMPVRVWHGEGKVHIRAPHGSVETGHFILTDMQGKILLSKPLSQGELALPLARGMYLVKLRWGHAASNGFLAAVQ